MAKQKRRNELAAGIFVLLALAGVFAILFMVADFASLFEHRVEYQVAFGVDQNIEGLTAGSAVKLGGYKIGNVTAVRPERRDQQGDPGWRMMVTIRIPAKYALAAEGLRIELVRPVVGTDATLNIADVGSGPAVAPGQTVPGGIASAPFLADAAKHLGFGDNEREAVQQAVLHVRNLVANLERSSEQIELMIQEGGQIRHIIGNVDAASDTLTGIMTHADAAVLSVRDMLAEDGIILRIAARLDDAAREAVDILRENRRNIQAMIDSAAAAGADAAEMTAQLKQQLTPLLAKVDAALSRADDALAGLGELTATANDLVRRNQVPINAMVDDYRAMAGHLKAASAEIRANPWRLLYQPTDKDKRQATLSEAARSFAVGAGQLNNAAEILTRLVAEHPDGDLAQSDQIQQALDVLAHSTANYRKVEHFLLEETARQP